MLYEFFLIVIILLTQQNVLTKIFVIETMSGQLVKYKFYHKFNKKT